MTKDETSERFEQARKGEKTSLSLNSEYTDNHTNSNMGDPMNLTPLQLLIKGEMCVIQFRLKFMKFTKLQVIGVKEFGVVGERKFYIFTDHLASKYTFHTNFTIKITNSKA